MQPVKLVVSDEPPPNTDHPLAGLSPSERHRQWLFKMAQLLAETAQRMAEQMAAEQMAAEQAAKGKEGAQ